MLSHFLSTLFILAIGLRAAIASDENDFENDPHTKRVPMKAFSIQPPYLDSDLHHRWFDFGGDTIIRTDQYLRLTSDRPSQRGWLWSRVPLTATNWQIELEFKLHGDGSLHGDGFAMWLTKERTTTGPVFGSADKFEGLGIFFDTYKNGRTGMSFPIVMAMMGDGHTAYDSHFDGKANDIGSCSARGIRGASSPTKARLTYFQDKLLALDLQYQSDGSWTSCFKITPSSNVPIKIPAISYLGFSAETGELSDNHDIIELNTYSLYKQSDDKTSQPASHGHETASAGKPVIEEKTGGSWLWSFFKFLMFLVIVAGAYVGWTAYRTKRMGSRF
ncbi:hypothetical protein LOZ53_002342 [Ophidiomyces ophidiicola]|uniref:Uncharacterized protein n=1 Tax=Ophidiomyces ophidiicola TaxID=1387563 RepID=A0ACB8UPM8_9EURO|nr:uncharacterized protein LOZ57_002771 [Ophidiomyces ophidiicola]KAI1911988.1 hypothetical protein LOZ61_003529 [Ophidiomyces ophidiicola]KAI1921965.1 hypothetical protein LOZ60_005989 [Ophidiomyces ophidiicola]KAI1926934.1 hypothetical protein LOZ64_000066 [Ophidiomyces ophidiicola]KAI1945370.1 hypothetical protein LOZ62_003870 [Ophidiomyces ophidiicola]KAI1948418.1 hypothetical protein LOZ57_002771 [Ophidiomyces ophidiicola]